MPNYAKDKLTQLAEPSPLELMSAELPKWIEQRSSALDNIQKIYDTDPRMKISPDVARGRAIFNNPYAGHSTMSLAAGEQARAEQENFLFNQAIAREQAILKHRDLSDFDKMYSAVTKQMNESKEKRQMVGSADQGWWAYNFDTGEKKLLIPGTLQQKQTAQLREVILNRLKEEGGDLSAHTKEADRLAQQIVYKYSPEEVDSYINRGGLPGSITSGVTTVPDKSSPQLVQGNYQGQLETKVDTGATPVTVDPNVPPGEGVNRSQFEIDFETALSGYQGLKMTDEQKMRKAFEFAAKLNPAEAAKIQGAEPTTQVQPKPLIVSTPQQIANRKAMGEGEYKSYQEYKDKLDSFYSANQAISAMEGMLESDKLNSGVFHEELNKLGGFLNYIDPSSRLAQYAGNDAAYYSKMMDLVRDKIKSLGAGTAVSNLDLIVTQKSVGDLRNTPQGNLKVMALMKLANATMGALYNEKIEHYDSNNNTFQGWKRDTTPTHALRYRLLPTGNWAFDVEDKASWIERARIANGGKLPDDIDSRWKIYADNSVKNLADPDKLLKKGK